MSEEASTQQLLGGDEKWGRGMDRVIAIVRFLTVNTN